MKDVEIAVGSIVGKDHLRLNKNNHDAYNIVEREDGSIVAVVCDGCGSGAHSEIGAKLAAFKLPYFINLIADAKNLDKAEITGVVELNNYITDLAIKMIWQTGNIDNQLISVIKDYFLFTCVVAIITERWIAIGSIGDGVYALNGNIKQIGPYLNNAPPYSSYGIVPYAVDEKYRNPKFQVHEIMYIEDEDFQSLMIGTDGVEDLQAAENKRVPGKDELVGPISQFWTEDKYFNNKMALQRRLVMINKEVVKVVDGVANRQQGYLRDDTTMIVVRAK